MIVAPPLAFTSLSLDPHWNLALEQGLGGALKHHPVIFLIWRCRDAVIIGKNQNPWIECNLPAMQKDGCLFARRHSGGGAVFHDKGNLNFSFITRPDHFNLSRQFNVILKILSGFGLRPQLTDKYAITVNGKKVSGSAFCHRKDFRLHHGTLLFNANLDRLRRFLLPTLSGVQTHAIPSLHSTVVNLRQVVSPSISMKDLRDELLLGFQEEYGAAASCDLDPDEPLPPFLNAATLTENSHRLAGWEWLHGMTPSFRASLPLGPRQHVDCQVEHGIIRQVFSENTRLVRQLEQQRFDFVVERNLTKT
ncbi:MAG: hypothetical protein PHV34_05490 [Verrucomicrobiae bacterium]|nr:hypothetical protein [Verrucomicrobiae bacterium]